MYIFIVSLAAKIPDGHTHSANLNKKSKRTQPSPTATIPIFPLKAPCHLPKQR